MLQKPVLLPSVQEDLVVFPPVFPFRLGEESPQPVLEAACPAGSHCLVFGEGFVLCGFGSFHTMKHLLTTGDCNLKCLTVFSADKG